LVAREDAGYRLTEAGYCAVSTRAGPRQGTRAPVALVQALLPPSLAPDRVAARLARRWFGDLRWYGRADVPGEAILTWLAPGGLAVRVRLLGSSLTLEAETDAAEPERAYAATRPLLAALAELYTPAPRGRPAGASGSEAAGVAG
ncbi:MAG TPA: hypothetical protein VI997_02245, partial [Candidatus Thermoplasmatota archaeon]|nr:hypothetical protein [Candidatus Thermoplasmatota archaeon]